MLSRSSRNGTPLAILVSQMMMRGFGSVRSAGRVEGRDESLDVVAVDALDVPAERLELRRERLEASTFVDGPSACWLLTSTMPIRLSSFQLAGRHRRLPGRALVELAVGEEVVDERGRLLALEAEAEADGDAPGRGRASRR